MIYEIEKKFLVPNVTKKLLGSAFLIKMIKQAYIGEGDNFVQRLRYSQVFESLLNLDAGVCQNQEAFFTIKEKTSGTKRIEVEQNIDIAVCNLMIGKEKVKVEKTRYCISQKEEYLLKDIPKEHLEQFKKTGEIYQNEEGNEVIIKTLVWELDIFEGDNTGLVTVEIEVEFEGQTFTIPDWVGKDITEEQRYYNHELSFNPYSTWEK